tara:strand:+ start:3013 stop:4419 length:1407 start_codon:yes stop_codon:yes gene_type:complete
MPELKWNLEKYFSICGICNNIIKKNCDLYFISNPTLNVIREHIFSLKKFDLIFKKSFFIKGIFIFFANYLYSILKIFFIIFKINKKKNNFSYKKIIFFSHSLHQNYDENNKQNDFYFSHITKEINSENLDIFYIKHHKSDGEKLHINDELSLINEIKIFLNLNSHMFQLIKLFIKAKDLERKIIFLSIINNFSQEHFKNLRIYHNTFFLLNIIKPKIIFTTFEGHSYERLIYAASYDTKNSIKRYAFSHSIIFKHQNAIKLKMPEKFSPNIIFTAGSSGLKFLEKNLEDKDIKIDVLGSNRFIERKTFKGKKIRQLLFIPEGYVEENDLFLNFANKILGKNKEIKILIRFHPIFLDQLNKIFKNNNNDRIMLSKNSNIEDDFKICEAFVFRGSTLAVQAARHGLAPIYYNRFSDLNINPFHDFPDGYKSVNNENQLNDYLKSNLIEFNNDFTNNYFRMIDIETLKKYL